MRVRRARPPQTISQPAGDLDRLVQGRLVVEQRQHQSPVVRDDQRVATLGPGDFFGEVGLLSTTWRVATVEALSPMRLLVIGPREFQTMMLTLPSVAEHVAQTAAERE